MTAFAIRADANVRQFKTMEEFNDWSLKICNEAKKRTGRVFHDQGEAAAAMGIHAYRIPQGGEDYWIVLNRGAIIAADNPQLPDRN